jgi:hypothetical protein
MSKFKAGDRVKIITGAFIGEEAIVVYNTGGVYCFNVKLKNNPDNIPELAYSKYELELIPEQKPKTKTVREYASVILNKDGDIKETSGFFTEEQLKKVETDYFNGEKIYHIIPTIFEDVEVPIKTETRWTFICKGSYTYYPSYTKYASLEQAKIATGNDTVQKIDDSAEEFEIE